MSDVSTLQGAIAAVHDPATTADDLAAIAHDFPKLRTVVVAHPNVYPELLEWLRQNGDDDVKRAVTQRLESQTMGPTGLGETIAGLPLWRSDDHVTPVADDTQGGSSQYLPDFLPYAPETGTFTQTGTAYTSDTGTMMPAGATFVAQMPQMGTPYVAQMPQTGTAYGAQTPQMGTPYAAQMQQPRSRRVNIGLVIAAIALGVALIVAGILVGIPGTGFHGVLKPGGSSGSGKKSAASYAYGYQKTWTVTASSLGIQQSDLPQGTSMNDMSINAIAQSKKTWLIEVDWWGSQFSGNMIFGVDAATGAKKWGPITGSTNSWSYCGRQPIRDTFYCYDSGSGSINAVDAETGKTTTIANQKDVIFEVLGEYLLITKWLQDGSHSTVSLMTTDGKLSWTLDSLGLVGSGEGIAPNLQTGGIVIINDDSAAYVVDVKSGEVLVSAAGNLGMVEKGRLWQGYGDLGTTEFTSSDGVKWKIDGGSGQNQQPVSSARSDSVAPLSFSSQNGNNIISWVEANGSLRWSASLPSPAYNWYRSTFDGKHLILSDLSGNTWALSPQDGTVLWHDSVGTGGLAGAGYLYYIIPDDDTIVIPTANGATARSVSTGALYWFTSAMWLSAVTDGSGNTALAGQTAMAEPPIALYRLDPALPQPGMPTPGSLTQPPASMPDCASVSWPYGGSYPDAAAYGKWNDTAGGANWLLICQGSSGYGVAKGGLWANDTLTFFEVTVATGGVYQTNFTGGDLSGVTVSLSPNGTYQVSGGASSHISGTAGWMPLVEGYFPNGGSASPGGQVSGSSNDAATQQVLSLQSLVWQNAYVRPSLSSYITACDASGIQQVLTLRQDFLAALQVSQVDQIPNGYQLLAVLQDAIQYSIQSDQTYLDWANLSCPKPVPTPQSDTDAGNAKDQFVAMWNSQIAGRYSGAEMLSTSQL